MSRRILHIVDSLDRTGTISELLSLGRGLREHGFDVLVAPLKGRGALRAEFAAAGIPVVEIDRRWPIDPIAASRLERLLYRFQPELVHTWGFPAGIHGRIAARLAGVRRLIANYHRIDPAMGGVDWFLDRQLAPGTERLIASGTAVRDWCVTHGLPAEKLAVIPPGVPPAATSDVSRDQLLRELHLPEGTRLIGVIGRLVPEKRVRDLIWAADLLRVLHDNLRLLVIGDGPLRSELERYAWMASDLEHIRFLGERDDVWRILPHLDVLWNGSDNRSVSIAILEAMAAGVPVVASDVAVNRELVIHGETGYLIPLGRRSGRADRARYTDHIFNDPALAARLAADSCRRARSHFALEESFQRYRQLIQ